MREPTAEQQAVLECEARIRVIRAVPGSGKTWLVAEYIRREIGSWSSATCGIAAMSFTRVGGDEIRRAVGRELGHPHYVGTIDAFLYRYVIRPFLAKVRPDIRSPHLIPADWSPSSWGKFGSHAIGAGRRRDTFRIPHTRGRRHHRGCRVRPSVPGGAGHRCRAPRHSGRQRHDLRRRLRRGVRGGRPADSGEIGAGLRTVESPGFRGGAASPSSDEGSKGDEERPVIVGCRRTEGPALAPLAQAHDGRADTAAIAAADARAVHSGSCPGDRGFQVIEPTWNPGRFNWLA